jgi:uncharacterized protein (DUF2062 family)/2-polyprenyl-3-methyl-5-hydroxy-6-metoxy-1,4-benzoquinol methylase
VRSAAGGGGPRGRLSALWRALRGQGSPRRLGFSVGLGLFIGCQPLYGLHLPLCVLVCLPFRLDAVVAYLAANISNPLLAPFLLLAEVEIGSLLLHGAPVEFGLEAARRAGISGFVQEAALGSLVFGAILGLLGGVLAAAIARRGQRRQRDPALMLAMQRTRARYAGAPRSHRYYVAAKLRADPVLAEIAEIGREAAERPGQGELDEPDKLDELLGENALIELDGRSDSSERAELGGGHELGDVVDAGAGRGQLGLCLLELGRVRSLVGFDFDAEKVEVARAAARGDATFRVGDLLREEIGPADTVLLVDVLHYLSSEEQARLIARAARALRGHGRLIVREADGEPGVRSIVTRALERVATLVGYNRVAPRQTLGFRPIRAIVAEMEAQGLECKMLEKASGAKLGNRLIVGRKGE